MGRHRSTKIRLYPRDRPGRSGYLVGPQPRTRTGNLVLCKGGLAHVPGIVPGSLTPIGSNNELERCLVCALWRTIRRGETYYCGFVLTSTPHPSISIDTRIRHKFTAWSAFFPLFTFQKGLMVSACSVGMVNNRDGWIYSPLLYGSRVRRTTKP